MSTLLVHDTTHSSSVIQGAQIYTDYFRPLKKKNTQKKRIVAHSSPYSSSRKALRIQLKYHNMQVFLGRAANRFLFLCVDKDLFFFSF